MFCLILLCNVTADVSDCNLGRWNLTLTLLFIAIHRCGLNKESGGPNKSFCVCILSRCHTLYICGTQCLDVTHHPQTHTCIQKKVKVHDRHLTASYMEVKIFEKSNVDIFVLMRNTKWYISHLHLYLHLMWVDLKSFISSEPRMQVREGGREQHLFLYGLFFF